MIHLYRLNIFFSVFWDISCPSLSLLVAHFVGALGTLWFLLLIFQAIFADQLFACISGALFRRIICELKANTTLVPRHWGITYDKVIVVRIKSVLRLGKLAIDDGLYNDIYPIWDFKLFQKTHFNWKDFQNWKIIFPKMRWAAKVC